jgi:hypothetical protein
LQAVFSVLSGGHPTGRVYQGRATASHRVASGDNITRFANEHHRAHANVYIGANNAQCEPPYVNTLAGGGYSDDRGCAQP